MVRFKYNKEIFNVDLNSLGVKSTILDVKETLAEQTNTQLDSIKLIISGTQLKNEYSVDQLVRGNGIRIGESIIKLKEESVVTMIATKRTAKAVEAPRNHEQSRVINDLTTDGFQPQVHPSQLRVNVYERPRERTEYEFHGIEVLPGLPDQDKAMELLKSLANDPAVLAVMQKHKWSVGLLKELYPEGKVGEDEVCVLGLNTNQGEKIELRIRTDDLQGFRKIQSIKKTLYHELAHNVHGPHDAKFYTLLRQIEKEIVELDWKSNQKGYSLKDNGTVGKKLASDQYIPAEMNAGTGTKKSAQTYYRLQDSAPSHSSYVSENNVFPATFMAAQAALFRLTEEELENEHGCGCVLQEIDKDHIEEVEELKGDVCADCDTEFEKGMRQYHSASATESTSVDERSKDKVMMEMVEKEEVVTPSFSSSTPLVVSSPRSNETDDILQQIAVEEVIQEISSSLDNSVALALNMDNSSSIERLLMMRESVMRILNALSVKKSNQRDVYNSLILLRTLIGNAKDLPDEKYRSIKSNSKKFENCVTKIDGAMQLLEAAGFEKCDEINKVNLKRVDPGLLYLAFSFVDLCVDVIDNAVAAFIEKSSNLTNMHNNIEVEV